jgi:hypothetical protein
MRGTLAAAVASPFHCKQLKQGALRPNDPNFTGIDLDSLREGSQMVTAVAATF